MHFAIMMLGIFFLGTSLLQASQYDCYRESPPPESSRSSSDATLKYGSSSNASPTSTHTDIWARPSSNVPLLPAFSLPPSNVRLEARLETLQVVHPCGSLGAIMYATAALAERRETLSPCTIASQLETLSDEDFYRLGLAAQIAPSSIRDQLSSDLQAIEQSAENLCRVFLCDINYPFRQRPAGHEGHHTSLWTAMKCIDVTLDEQGRELTLVQFFMRIYGENIDTSPLDDIQLILTPDHKIHHLQRLLTSWGSSLDLLKISEPHLSSILELFVGRTHVKGLLELGHAACRYTYRLNSLTPRLVSHTPPPVVQPKIYPTDTWQEIA